MFAVDLGLLVLGPGGRWPSKSPGLASEQRGFAQTANEDGGRDGRELGQSGELRPSVTFVLEGATCVGVAPVSVVSVSR